MGGRISKCCLYEITSYMFEAQEVETVSCESLTLSDEHFGRIGLPTDFRVVIIRDTI